MLLAHGYTKVSIFEIYLDHEILFLNYMFEEVQSLYFEVLIHYVGIQRLEVDHWSATPSFFGTRNIGLINSPFIGETT